MKTSVVICAYTEDRWDDIAAAVASVRAQTVPARELILVVDHNPDLHLRLKRACPDAIVLENAHDRGLSGGKNTGTEAATGEYVAFLDDDAVADPGWIEGLESAMAGPGVVGAGGLTRPLWATRRPRWFPAEFDWTVGCTYKGMPETRAPIRNVMGGNAIFRREVIGAVGGFSTGIGRSVKGGRSRPLGCEETEFCIRLTQRMPGAVLLFEPSAGIGHKVPAARETFRYFRSRCYAEGLSKALVTRSVGSGDGLASERSYTFRTLPLGALKGLVTLRPGRSVAIVVGLAWTTWGYLVGKARR
ncbi:glycosyltransferase family 2 protein [Herbidospora cretacea]|uniref:glycosyltransferase family 2 protein n=1 Tax=Herbidospora cretacea TaxID=28444 RepID=UPI0007739374|nr:glycosyltransferase family 2 protein [Herbidospora cretacea]